MSNALKQESAEQEAQHRPLSNNAFKQQEFARAFYRAEIPAGVPFSELEQPNYWSNVAMLVPVGSRVEVIAQDLSFWAEGIVVSQTRTSAKIQWFNGWGKMSAPKQEESDAGDEELAAAIARREAKEQKEPKDSGHPDQNSNLEAGWGGGAHKWRIIRAEDNEVLEKGFETREAAEARILEIRGLD